MRCFAENEGGVCAKCFKKRVPFKRVAGVFEYEGPAASLIRGLKFASREELAKDMAAWMVVQLLELRVPLPDLIVPVPQPLWRTWMRGYNQSDVLAKEVGVLLERPVLRLLKRKSGDFPQSELSRVQREQLTSSAYVWKRRCIISDKIVLVVDDVATTGATLRACGEVLEEGFPAALYALTFCRTAKE